MSTIKINSNWFTYNISNQSPTITNTETQMDTLKICFKKHDMVKPPLAT